MKNPFYRRGISILPVLVLGLALASLLVYVVSRQKSAPSPEEKVKAKLAAVSAVNKVALNLREAGSLPPRQVISSDGLDVTVTSQPSADGNTIQIVATGGGEVLTAKAVRTDEPVATAPATVTSTPTTAPVSTPATSPGTGLVPNPVVEKYLSGTGAYLVGYDAATGEYRAYTNGKYIVLARNAAGKLVPTANQPYFPPQPAAPASSAVDSGMASTSSKQPLLGQASEAFPAATSQAKWVIYDDNNSVISSDSASRGSGQSASAAAGSPSATSPAPAPPQPAVPTIRIVSKTAAQKTSP